jgi:hypothetical protein
VLKNHPAPKVGDKVDLAPSLQTSEQDMVTGSAEGQASGDPTIQASAGMLESVRGGSPEK